MLSIWRNLHRWLHQKLSNDNFRCSQRWKFRQNDISGLMFLPFANRRRPTVMITVMATTLVRENADATRADHFTENMLRAVAETKCIWNILMNQLDMYPVITGRCISSSTESHKYHFILKIRWFHMLSSVTCMDHAMYTVTHGSLRK